MRQNVLLTIFIALLLLVQTGCSKNEGETKNETQATEVTDKGPLETDTAATNTLGEKTFPIRNPENTIVTIETDYGKMVLELYHDVAPAHADSFVARTEEGFYNGLLFHRVVKNFMIQGGDPRGNGTGNAGYYLNAEFSDLKHQDGTLSMARGQSPNSASCQFFICLARNRSTEYLDGKYTVFGQLLKGYDVLHTIGDVPTVPQFQGGEVSKPQEDIVMRKVYLSDAEGNPL